MDIKYVKELTERLSFPDEAAKYIVEQASVVEANSVASVLMDDAIATFERTNYSNDGTKDRMDSIEQVSGVHKYTVACIILLACCKKLEERYAECGYSNELFIDTMSDIRYKLIECKQVHGVWGCFVFFWFPGFFRMERFALGRFQFEKREYPENCTGVNGHFVRKGDTVLNFHIPSSGISLTDEVRYDSYKKAREFFFPDAEGPVPFVCSSWLLWPGYESYLPANSNLMAFRHDFILVNVTESSSFNNAWRVFGAYAEKDVSEWPRDTSQRRAFAKYTEDGHKHGNGYGLILFDGEKIVR